MSGYHTVKKRVFEIIEKSNPDDRSSFVFDIFIITLIILSVIAIVAESFQRLYVANLDVFRWFEIFTVTVFSLEYFARVWTSDEFVSGGPVRARVRYIFTPAAVIDLLAILPFYIPWFVIDLRFIRVFRLLRLFRLFKLGRYIAAVYLLEKVIRNRRGELFVTFFFAVLLLTISSVLIYYFEGPAQPDKFPNILEGFWWSVSNVSSFALAKYSPVTLPGKILGFLLSLLGLGLIALPAGILSSGFMQEIQRGKKDRE